MNPKDEPLTPHQLHEQAEVRKTDIIKTLFWAVSIGGNFDKGVESLKKQLAHDLKPVFNCPDRYQPQGAQRNRYLIEIEAVKRALEAAKMYHLPIRKCQIISKRNPEWGTWGISEDRGDWYEIRGDRGSRILFKSEAVKFWELVK